ncbi:MAG: bifunctional D-glycero-beta-D-manno-heptose-7-phosphate kinase/D-glycero-beta-D-manno-heptose 1-phosphate adenylyltransferase HldE [Planctomycetota bacterium]|nr:bifunctional D-glycero-beta-D-manno-heptose-7-phosphate kinase/D-glycero-beta-D-manno-heptose 1-phosphate adenylyltransferase HldE [Planctomycetota bacterium]
MNAHPPSDVVLPLIERGFDAVPVLVFGDVMLDRHVTGSVGRISPEAPVPVVHVKHERETPGGAGNVALNLAALGCRPCLVGLVGDDSGKDALVRACAAAGVDTTGLVTVSDRPTITKTRIIGGHQQMIRLDVEEPGAPDASARAALEQQALALVTQVRAVVISDYAKGVVQDSTCAALIGAARAAGIPVLVDPKGSNWAKYHGATTISPNRAELAAVAAGPIDTWDQELDEARRLIDELNFDFISLTRSEQGMALIAANEARSVPALAREVYDVSGAGDTAIATMAACLAVGIDRHDGLRLANVAAGIVVGKVGTAPIERDALLVEVLAEVERRGASKVCSLEQMLQRCTLWRARGETMVFTNGCFDLLHAGHVSYLEKARELGDRLIIGLNSDASVSRLKGPERPIVPEAQRATVLAALGCVDAVVVFDQDTPLELITALKPMILAKGADYAENEVVGGTEVKSWGGQVALVELVPGVSTTAIAKRMK